jgi:hypothetical protein
MLTNDQCSIINALVIHDFKFVAMPNKLVVQSPFLKVQRALNGMHLNMADLNNHSTIIHL